MSAVVIFIASVWLWSIIGLGMSALLFLLSILMAFFFRDPKRETGKGIVSPADGRIELPDGDGRKLSVVLGLRNVHVTRAPHSGRVVGLKRLGGTHIPAFEEVSDSNKRVEIELSSRLGDTKLVLITGFVARRILPYVNAGDNLKKGDRVGVIMFGSRVDLHLPPGCRITARPGDNVKAGESQIAEVVNDAD
jgi:phosphatidylserine decarboxylase